MASILSVEQLRGLSSGDNPNTITLPTGQTLDFSAGTLSMPAGYVIQVVQGTTTSDTTVSATTYTDTTLTASITPSSTSSKILVVVSQSTYASRSAGSARIQFKLLRGSTSLQTFTYASSVVTGAASTEMGNIIALSYLDSPATTSSVTYKTQGRPSTTSNGEEARFQVGSSPSTITLMEIAG